MVTKQREETSRAFFDVDNPHIQTCADLKHPRCQLGDSKTYRSESCLEVSAQLFQRLFNQLLIGGRQSAVRPSKLLGRNKMTGHALAFPFQIPNQFLH